MRPSPHDETLDDPSASVRVPASLEHGAFVGRYVVLTRVGAGGMGVVYTAHDPELGRVVALKLMHPARQHASDGLARLTREAQAMAQLSHPNVLPIHDVGEYDGGVFLAMEFVQGSTLRAWLSAQRRTRRDVLAVLRQAGEGLAAAHAKGLVHRDFKPDNVIIGDDGRARVMDFGLARFASDAVSTGSSDGSSNGGGTDFLRKDLTREGAVLGTPRYMAPEQLNGEEIDAQADQFAFCLTLYEALYGDRAFQGDSFNALCVAVTHGVVQPPPAGAKVPTWLRGVVLRGLVTDPIGRWPSMRALLTALEHDPLPRRRAALGGVAVLSVVGATAAWNHWDARHRAQACDLEATTIDHAWNPTVKDGVRAAMLATEVGHAEASFERTTATLDAYATQWTEVRGGLCRDARVARTLPEARYALAATCLDDLAAEVGALAQLLAKADATSVHGAVAAASSLVRVTTCADIERLARRPLPPGDLREATGRLREQLAAAATRRALGDFQGARDEAQAALTDAEAQGAVVYRARALVELGIDEYELGHFDEANARLVAAVEAAGAAGADEIAAEASAFLVYVVGSMKERVAEGMLWSRMLEMWLDRMATPPDDPRRGIAASYRASVLEESGDWPAARVELEHAVAILDAAYGQDHPETALTTQNLAILLHMTGDHDAALQVMGRSLAARERIFGPDHPEVASALANYGGILSGVGRKDEAVQGLRRSLAIRESALNAEHPLVAHSLYSLAYALGPTDEAIAMLERAVTINEKALGPEHPDVATCINDLGMIARDRGDHETALARFTRATAIVEASLGTEHPLFARLLFNRAAAERSLGDLATARVTFDRVADVIEVALPGGAFTAEAWEGAGRTCLAQGDARCAIDRLERAVVRYKATGPADAVAVAERSLEEARQLRAAPP